METDATATAEADLTTETAEEATPTSDAEEKKVFDELVKEADKAEKSEEPAETEEEATEETPPAEEAEDASPAEPEGFDEAVKAAVRENVPESQLTAWYETDPEGFIKWGLGRAKKQADQDRFGNEVAKLKRQQASAEPTPGGESVAATDGRAPSGPLNERINELLKPLREGDNADLIGEAHGPVAGALNALVAEIQRLDGQVQQQQQERQFAEVQRTLDGLRPKLTESFPGISESRDWQGVLEEYDDLVIADQVRTANGSEPRYPDAEAALHKAAQNYYAGQDQQVTAAKLKQDLLNRSKSRKAGKPRSPTAAPGETKISPEKEEELAFYQMARRHLGSRE
jgi:hypothetical protein